MCSLWGHPSPRSPGAWVPPCPHALPAPQLQVQPGVSPGALGMNPGAEVRLSHVAKCPPLDWQSAPASRLVLLHCLAALLAQGVLVGWWAGGGSQKALHPQLYLHRGSSTSAVTPRVCACTSLGRRCVCFSGF